MDPPPQGATGAISTAQVRRMAGPQQNLSRTWLSDRIPTLSLSQVRHAPRRRVASPLIPCPAPSDLPWLPPPPHRIRIFTKFQMSAQNNKKILNTKYYYNIKLRSDTLRMFAKFYYISNSPL